MEVSKAHRFVWIIGAVFVFVPHFSMGLLSDYKICGDPECESLMSRVQAIKDHHGKDCRFLTFRRGDTIFVYHKLTGKRDDIWAGTIDKQFGYFPKDAVREEQVYATTEKVVETQKSDFFCMDESGYPIDTSYLDSVDDNHRQLQTQKSETIQMSPNSHATNSEDHSANAEPSTESKVEAKEAEEETNLRDAAEPNEKTSAAQEEQGGSPSSAWLGSSVTGWLGFSNEEQSGNLDKGDKDESTETEADTSISSSVTGWLSFGGETKTDDSKEIVIPKEDSFTSTMTGWLGFGGEKQTGSPKDEQNEEEGTDKETEPTETFRSRRMSLDLEGSESEEEEKEEIGTLGWLGSGLSSRLGFGQNKQDSGHGPTSGGEGDEEKEQTKSWMDIGIGGILGLGKDKSKESEAESDKIFKQTAGSDRSSGSQASLTHEVKVETSNELQTPTHVPATEPVRADDYEFIDSSVRMENSILDAEAELKVEHNDASLQAVAETSSNNITTIKDEIDTNLKNNFKIDEDFSAEIEAEVSQISDSRKENIETTETREPEENITNTTGNNQDFKAQPKSPENNYDDVNSNSVKQFEYEDDKNQMQSRMPGNVEEEEGAKITNSVHNLEDFSYLPEKSATGDDYKEEPLEVSLDLSQRQVFPTQTEDSAEERRDGAESNKQSQLFLSSFEEINDNVPVEGGFTPPILESNDSNSNTPGDKYTGDNVEMEIHHGELETEAVQGRSQEVKLLYSGRKNTETLYENASVEDSGTILTNRTTTNISKTLESQQSFKDKVKEIEKETLGFQEDILSLNDLKSTLLPKIKTEEIKKTEKGENKEKTKINGDEEKNQLDVNEGKEEVEEEEEQIETEDINEKQNMDRKLPEQEKLEEVEDSRGEEKDESNEKGSGEEGMESEKEQLQKLKKENKQTEELEQEKQVRVEGVKESKETKEKGENKEDKQEEGGQWEKIQSDIRRPELENNIKDNSLESLFSEIVTQTDDQMTEEIKEDVDQVDKEKVQEEEEVVGKQQMKHVEDEKLKCIDQICAQDSKDAAVIEGDGHSSEDGGSSAGAAAAWIGETKYEEMQVEEKASNNAVGGNDEQRWKTENAADEHESYRDDGELLAQTSDPVESQTQSPEQTPSEDPTESSHPPGASESNGAFGVFRNTFSFFSQTPNTGSTENVQSFNTKSAETSEPRASLTPEPELDSTTDPLQDPVMHTVPPTELSNPTSTENIHHSAPSATETPPKIKTLTKQHHNLLMYMTSDESAILLELFGRHKLQFLDYVLAGSEAVTAGDDQSILSDIERLLHHHTETLVAPSMRLTDAPQEDQKKTRTLVALQKLETLLKTIKDTFSTGISDVSKQQGEEKKEISHDSLETEEKSKRRDEQMTAGKDGVGGGAIKEKEFVDEENRDRGSKEGAYQKGLKMQTSDFNHEDSNIFMWLTVQVVSSLPDDMQPGPDLYGVPWEPVIITGLVGLVTFLLFTCRCYSSIKSRMYRSKERCMSEQIAQLLDEKCKVLETLGQCQQEYDDLETSLKDGGVLAQTQKTEHLGVQARQLECNKKELGRDLEHLKDQLDQQKEHRKEQERRIAALEEYIKTFEEETKDLQSQEEQAQTTLKIYEMNSDRLQRNLETSQEENIVLQESNNQLRQQVEGWAERVSELEAEMQRCEVAHSVMLQDVANKDERIMSLTDRLLRMKGLNPDLEEDEDGGENEATNGTPGMEDGNGGVLTDAHLQKVQKLIYAAKINADLKSVDEDKDRVFAKLNDEIKAKEDLQMSIKELENEKLSLHSDSKHYSDEVERLQQKLHIMTEMYQENELKLHRMLTVEEKERLQKEEKLNKADKNIAMALEELNNYRKRAEEMEEELEKTKQSYQTQISAHEKKAHNNWLAARAAERDLGDIRRENALFRQKLTDTQFKLDSLDKDPYALNSLARPLPFRGERSPYGPSPLGRPSSETRPFLSPPTLMDGPPTRLSPRVSRGPVEPPVGQGEMERSGGPHSDSGSNSPSWERDRRGPPPGPPGPLGPPGYMFPEPGGPMFRRPPPAALGLLPPPGSIPPGPLPPRSLPPVLPHPADMADGSFRETRLGPGDQELRLSGPGDRRTPPESDPRMGGPPFSGPPMIPIDGPFPRRTPYGPPPPPDFYPPRGPGVPPMMPMWPPPRQGMMLPPRFPPGGPPLPPMSHPNMHPYGPPLGHPPPDGIAPSSMGPPPPQQSLAPPPHSQSPEESVPSPEDAI